MTIETAKTAEMVTTDNRPRRRISLNGHKGLNKQNMLATSRLATRYNRPATKQKERRLHAKVKSPPQ